MDEVEVEGVEPPALTVGEELRAAREQAGMTLEEIATQTRIPTRHLESLEQGDFDRLPAPTYTIGFAKNYAAAVGLDPGAVSAKLRAQLGNTRPPVHTYEAFEPADPARAMPNWLIFAALAAIALVVLAFGWLRSRELEPTPALPEQAAAPATSATPPPAPVENRQVTITATDKVWAQVADGSNILFEGEMAPGQSFAVPATASAPMLKTGRPEALKIMVGSSQAPAVGPAGTSVSNVSLLPADLMAPKPAAAAPAAAPATAPKATAATRPARQSTPPATPPKTVAATTPDRQSAPPTRTSTNRRASVNMSSTNTSGAAPAQPPPGGDQPAGE